MEIETTRTTGGSSPSTDEVVEGLNDLLQLDHDALGAYDVAIERLEDRDHADQIAGYRRDHERHVRELTEAITTLGGTPKNEPHVTGPLKKALQAAGAAGGDRGLLIAWRVNELQVRTKYDSYAHKAVHWPSDLKRLVDRNALDEERHFEWITNLLERMGVPTAKGLEDGVTTRLREGMGGGIGGAVGEKVDQVKERASELAGDVRDRITDEVHGRADQLKGEARQRAEALRTGASERASGMADSAREKIAGGLESGANRISHLVEEDSIPGGPRGADAARRVAGGLDSTAWYVREGSLAEARTDMERQIRQKPVQTLAAAALVGFVIGRILR